MKKAVSRAVGLILAAVMAAAMMGCSSPKAEEGAQPGNTESDALAEENTGSGETTGQEASGGDAAASADRIVNIGVTDSLGGINPFTIDQTWINKYAVGLQFLPLVELDGEDRKSTRLNSSHP